MTGPAFWPSAGWVALAVGVQAVAAPWISFHHALPSFATIGVVLYALRVGARRGAALGLVAGALSDALAGSGGGWTLADVTIALLTGAVARRVFADGVIPPTFIVLVAVFARNAIFWTVSVAEGYPRGYGTLHLHAAVWQSLLTATCALGYLIVRTRIVGEGTRIERYT